MSLVPALAIATALLAITVTPSGPLPTRPVAPPAAPAGGAAAALFGADFTGGPGGDFDWHLPPGERFLLDTSGGRICGGPDGLATRELRVVDGRIQVRDFHLGHGASLLVTGDDPIVIFASGTVQIDGLISVDGNDGEPVFTLCLPEIPRPAGLGNAGGGAGGRGSPETSQSSARGEDGEGAFRLPGQGGKGGESGWHPTNLSFGANRRGAGGGGGVFAPDRFDAQGCLDQSVIGLDAEDGFPGPTTARAALRPGELMPWGGRRGEGPFVDANPRNDFYGLMIQMPGTSQESLIQGELPQLWAGAGGGGGGDSVRADVFPPPALIACDNQQGCGGGGGAGGLMILARGDIRFGPEGRLSANGGNGSGGENTNFVNRIGGGSGGGSGGHIVLQSLARIDLSALPPGTPAITALGGQGGAGADNQGGVGYTEQTTSFLDAKHVGVSGPEDTSDNPWIPPVPPECQLGAGVVRGAGGDGGPGVIQLHVRHLDAILPPGGDPASIPQVVLPRPIGYAPPGSPTQAFLHLLPPIR